MKRALRFPFVLCTIALTASDSLSFQPAQSTRNLQLEFESSSHHAFIGGRRVVSGYEIGLRNARTHGLVRERNVGLPPADPDGLVRIQIAPWISDLPDEEYEIRVRILGPFGNSGWSDWISMRLSQ